MFQKADTSLLCKVQFHEVDEFVADLRKDKALVYRSLVRVTRVYDQAGAISPCYLSVVATVIVGRTLVRLKKRCGEVPSPQSDHSTLPAEEDADKLLAILETELYSLGLEVRAGVFE